MISLRRLSPTHYLPVCLFICLPGPIFAQHTNKVSEMPAKIIDSFDHRHPLYPSTDTQHLQLIEITGKIPLIQNKADRLIYRTERDPAIAGGNAADVLRKVPMLSVDATGNVSLRGKTNVSILVNGKTSGAMNNNTSAALQMIPATQIKNVEVITSPPSSFDGEGTPGIINIVLKRDSTQGTSGSLTGQLGTRQNNFNGNLFFRKNKLAFTAGLGDSWSWPAATSTSFDQYRPGGELIISQRGANKNHRRNHSANISLDYTIDTSNLIISNFNLHRLSVNTDNKLNSVYATGQYISSSSRDKKYFGGFDWSADYIRKFTRRGIELSISAQYTKDNNNTRYSSRYEQAGSVPNETAYNSGISGETTFQADYKHSIRKSVVEVGAKTILRTIVSQVKVDTMTRDGLYQNVKQRTYDFIYRQNVGAAYASISAPIGNKVEFKGGVRYEYTLLTNNAASQYPEFRKEYNHFLPSIALSYKTGSRSDLRVTYNLRIQRPGLYFLNPFRNQADPVNQVQGNPDLGPELAHNIELGNSLAIKNGLLNLSVYYRKTTNVIETIYKNIMDQARPVVLQGFGNTGSLQSFGSNVFASINVMKVLMLRGNIDIYTYEIKPKHLFSTLTEQANKPLFNYKTFFSATLGLKKGWVVESFLFFDAPERTFQGYYAAFNMWNINVKKAIFKNKGAIGLTIIDPFTDAKSLSSYTKTPGHEQWGNFTLPFRSFGISFTCMFGKSNTPRTNRHPGIQNDDLKADK